MLLPGSFQRCLLVACVTNRLFETQSHIPEEQTGKKNTAKTNNKLLRIFSQPGCGCLISVLLIRRHKS